MNEPSANVGSLDQSPPPVSHPAILFDGVWHKYDSKRWALSGMSFSVAAGELHGFVGPNGAGKTTSLKLICTLLPPQEGKIEVFGHDVVYKLHDARRTLGFMPDHFSTYRKMTVYEYLDFFAAAYGQSYKTRGDTIADILALVDMSSRKNDIISGLSRGMQQRTSLARVLINDPKLLLLDEPASGLDPRARIELMDILKALQSMGKTILISSHILSELADLCDSVTVVDQGKAKFSGKMDDLLARGETTPIFRLKFAETEGVETRLQAITGVLAVEPGPAAQEYRVTIDPAVIDTNSLLAQILSARLTVRSFAEDRRQLNEAFMALTTGGVGA